MTLEKINDDLVEFLPYEIDEEYIKDLLTSIVYLKIQRKKDIPYYQGMKEYEIWNDTLGVSILYEMIEFYHEKDPILADNAEMVLRYLGNYQFADKVNMKLDSIYDFMQEYHSENCRVNLLEYFKEKVKMMQDRRFMDSEFDYSRNREFTEFEMFLSEYNLLYCKEGMFSQERITLEDSLSEWDDLVKFSGKTDKIAEIIHVDKPNHKNKLYDLDLLFSSIDLKRKSEKELRIIYGSLVNLVAGNRFDLVFQFFVEQLGDSKYTDLFTVFNLYKEEVGQLISSMNLDNYQQILNKIRDTYHLSIDRIKTYQQLDKEVKIQLKKISKKEKVEQLLDNSIQCMQKFLASEFPIETFCKEMKISVRTFYKYKKVLENHNANMFMQVQEESMKNQTKNIKRILSLVDEVYSQISNGDSLDLLEYSLKTKLNLLELAMIANNFGKPNISERIRSYMNTNKFLFQYYNPVSFINSYSVNGRKFTKSDNQRLKSYFEKEELPPINGIAIVVIDKILKGEELPSRKENIEDFVDEIMENDQKIVDKCKTKAYNYNSQEKGKRFIST